MRYLPQTTTMSTVHQIVVFLHTNKLSCDLNNPQTHRRTCVVDTPMNIIIPVFSNTFLNETNANICVASLL